MRLGFRTLGTHSSLLPRDKAHVQEGAGIDERGRVPGPPSRYRCHRAAIRAPSLSDLDPK